MQVATNLQSIDAGFTRRGGTRYAPGDLCHQRICSLLKTRPWRKKHQLALLTWDVKITKRPKTHPSKAFQTERRDRRQALWVGGLHNRAVKGRRRPRLEGLVVRELFCTSPQRLTHLGEGTPPRGCIPMPRREGVMGSRPAHPHGSLLRGLDPKGA